MNKKNSPMVSVVIPAYNAAKSIGRTLNSVLAQTFDDFEVIVVDDGSQDGTANTVLSLQDGRIHLHRHTYNQGAAAARNSGIHLAQGELVAFLDADDVWTRDKLAVQVRFMQDHPQTGASVTSFWYDTEEGFSLQILHQPKSWLKEFLKGCAVSPGTTLMVRKSCYKDIGGYDKSLPRHEDLDWLLRFVQQYELGVVQRPLAIVHRSSRPSAEKIEQANEILVKRYHSLFYTFGRFYGSQAIGKRWLETSIHHFSSGNKQRGFTYLWRTLRENPFQRPTMYLRVVDGIFGTSLFLTLKKNLLKVCHHKYNLRLETEIVPHSDVPENG